MINSEQRTNIYPDNKNVNDQVIVIWTQYDDFKFTTSIGKDNFIKKFVDYELKNVNIFEYEINIEKIRMMLWGIKMTLIKQGLKDEGSRPSWIGYGLVQEISTALEHEISLRINN